tara:strand:- start:4910 stop:5140 length:231 start_codon:yes stop_codon:yes gene_type:complete
MKLLQEDDCAPDAREYFEKDFVTIMGMNVRDFCNIATKQDTPEDIVKYVWGDYYLEFSADSPYWEFGTIDPIDERV